MGGCMAFASRQILLRFCLIVTAVVAGLQTTTSAAQTILFTENFDNSNFASRGWYDSSGGVIDTTVFSPSGGNSSIRFSFAQAANRPTGGTPHRHSFTPSESVYVSFWLKLGTSSVPWQGSGVSFHPHVILLLTDANGAFDGLAWNRLTFYIEWNSFKPRLAIQDGQRINLSQLTNSYPGLLGSASPHAVAGGNGPQNQTSPSVVDYYSIGAPDYTNATFWDSVTPNLVNNRWQYIEAYIAMNSVSAGIPQPNGVVKYWVDGMLVVDKNNVYLRTAQYPTQKFNQFVIAPYIEPGSGSPIAQSIWIDNLVVANQRPASTIPAPTNLRVQ
jgi:hypothetical protein